MYKNMFLMCIKEKFGKFYLLYCSLLGILTIWIEKTLSYGILFTLILFTAIQIARMVCFPAINCINNGFASFRIQKAKNTLILSLLANLPWLFFIIIKTWMSNLTMLLPIILIWIYCTILGTLIGIYIKNEIISYAIMLLCFFFCIQKILIHELYFRYISPVLIFRGQLYSYNLLGIIIFSAFSIAILLVLKKKQKIILLLMMLLCFVALTFYEINKETIIENTKTISIQKENYTIEYNPTLKPEYTEHIAKLLTQTQHYLKEYGFLMETTKYHMNFTIYFPWEHSQQKIFIKNDNNICHINFYTNSLCNMSEEELITRYIYSILNPNTQLQEIAVELLIKDITSQVIFYERASELSDFSYNKLVENYGYCISPKQCAIVECMAIDPTSFQTLYTAFESVNNLQEIEIETLGVNTEYENLYRRIIE